MKTRKQYLIYIPSRKDYYRDMEGNIVIFDFLADADLICYSMKSLFSGIVKEKK